MSSELTPVVPATDAPMSRSMSIKTNTVVNDEYKSPAASIMLVCGQVMTQIENKSFTKENIVSILQTIMEVVEVIPRAKTVSKKQLALDCIHWLINQQANISDLDKTFLLDFVDMTAPSAIDIIVTAANGLSALSNKVKCCC